MKEIKDLRLKNMSYQEISAALNLSINTVKSYCRRNNLGGIRKKEEGVKLCPNCGEKVQSMAGRKEKRFCSDQCRQAWWNKNLDRVRRKAFYAFTCSYCQEPFNAYGNKKRKYCSHACYIKDRFGHDES